jgi:hypothetical protein
MLVTSATTVTIARRRAVSRRDESAFTSAPSAVGR